LFTSIELFKVLQFVDLTYDYIPPLKNKLEGEDEPATIPELECGVCLINKKSVTITKCGHVFCKSCVIKCNQCPICRISYNKSHLLKIFL